MKHVYSASRHDEGLVTVRFEVGEQIGPSIVKVYEKLQSNLDKMPPGVEPPLVKQKGIDDVPIVTVTLWSNAVDDAILRTLAINLLQEIKQVKDTGVGFVVGGRARQIRVVVQPERLASYGVSLGQIAQLIHSANYAETAGSAEADNQYFELWAGGFLQNADDLAGLIVGLHNGNPVYLRDIAQVSDGPAELQHLVQQYAGPAYKGTAAGAAVPDGAAAVTLAIAKKVGSNGVEVAHRVRDKIAELQGRLIPDNVKVELTRDYGKTAEDKVNELVLKLFIATGAVSVLTLVALGLRPAVVVTIVIPVVILITVFAAYIGGYSINRVSLFAFIFAIGILVDDAIVVVENIYRRWLAADSTDTATAIDAVREVGNPTIIATLTVVAALVPMAFVRGMMGPYMEPIPVLGSTAMLFSLFAAFALTPWLTRWLRPSRATLERSAAREHAMSARTLQLFRCLLKPMIQRTAYRWLFLLALIGAFFGSLALFPLHAVVVKMLPYDNKSEFSIAIDMPAGTALPVTISVTQQMVDALQQIPEILAIQSYVGTAEPYDFNGMVRHYYLRRNPWQAQIHVQLLDKADRARSSHAIAQSVRPLLQPIAERGRAELTIVEMPPGPPVLQTLVAEVYGPTTDGIRAASRHLTDLFRDTPGVADVQNSMKKQYPVLRFEPDRDKAQRLGITDRQLADELSYAMGGRRVGDAKIGGALEPTFIVLETPYAARANVEKLSDLPLPTAQGGSAPLIELGRFAASVQDPIIYHKDLRTLEYVVGDAIGRLDSPIYPMAQIDAALANYEAPDGNRLTATLTGPPPDDGAYGFEWAGEWTVTYETFRDLGIAFAVSLLVIYFLLVMEFDNFVIPVVIMAPIPLTLLGIIPGHWIMGAEFTATSMIGFIALAGIIVRNSILLVDFTVHAMSGGATAADAVLAACQARTRPILITALALVGGSIVIVTDPIFQGMAVSLLFGVLVSTLLTLFVVPLGCVSASGPLTQCRQYRMPASVEEHIR